MHTRHAKKSRLAAPKGLLVDILCILSDSNHTHFHHVLPRIVALGCKELAPLVLTGRLKPKGIYIRSPSIEDRDGEELADIKASYDCFMMWYPKAYTVLGVTVTAPFLSSRDKSTDSSLVKSFFDFYDNLIFIHSHTIEVLKLDLTTPSLSIISSFLDSVKMCFQATHLTLNMPCLWVTHKIFSLKAQQTIRHMSNLQHLSFSAFWNNPLHDPFLTDPESPCKYNHVLYLLPKSLVSLRLAGSISPPMARFNENVLTEMFSNNKLPCLTTVDLNAYQTHKKFGRDALETKFSHPNSRVNRLVLPVGRLTTNMNLLLTLDQGNYLQQAGSEKPFTLVIFHTNPVERTSRVDTVTELIEKYNINNVQVEVAVD